MQILLLKLATPHSEAKDPRAFTANNESGRPPSTLDTRGQIRIMPITRRRNPVQNEARHAAALALVDYRCRLNSRGELLRTGPLISAPSSSFHFLQNVRRKHIGIVRGYEQTPLMLARVRLRRRRRQAIGLRSRLIGLRRGGTSSQHQNQRQSSNFHSDTPISRFHRATFVPCYQKQSTMGVQFRLGKVSEEPGNQGYDKNRTFPSILNLGHPRAD